MCNAIGIDEIYIFIAAAYSESPSCVKIFAKDKNKTHQSYTTLLNEWKCTMLLFHFPRNHNQGIHTIPLKHTCSKSFYSILQ